MSTVNFLSFLLTFSDSPKGDPKHSGLASKQASSRSFGGDEKLPGFNFNIKINGKSVRVDSVISNEIF